MRERERERERERKKRRKRESKRRVVAFMAGICHQIDAVDRAARRWSVFGYAAIEPVR